MKSIKQCMWMTAAALTFCAGAVSRAADVELLHSTIIDQNALNFSSSLSTFSDNVNGRTFQRFPMATSRGYQYATYYDLDRYVCVARRKLPEGRWDVVRFTDYKITGSDSHNVTSIGICEADGTIHLMFDHHADPLNYRVSVLGAALDPDNVVWSTDLFSPVTDRLGAVGYLPSVTYPTFFNAPNGNLMLYYRNGGSGNGDGMIQEYNGVMHDWTLGLGKFIARTGSYSGSFTPNSTSRCPYINGISYGGTRLHASWGWRETGDAASNHDLNYAYSDDDGRSWQNSDGTQIGITGSSYITIDSPGLVVAPIPQENGLANQYTHYAFADGSCHVMLEHYNASRNMRYHHYRRDATGVWSGAALSFDGSRPKICGDDDGNLFLVYEKNGNPRIAKGIPNAGKTAWNWSEVYTQNISEGGEGQLDYSRWEADRVLSFFGQEKPPSNDEVPSPLHVFDYKVSSKATQPMPAHGALVQEVDAGLEWSAGLGATVHQVYFGTNAQAVAEATTGSPEYQGQQSGTVFVPAPALSEYGTYYWRIDEVQADSTVIPGQVWAFRIGAVLPPDIWAPVAHWPLDEAAGTLANDVSGNGYAGTLENGAAWGRDTVRDSFVVFDGTDDRISTLFTYALNAGDDFTWAWWANKQSPEGSDNTAVMVGNRYGNTGSEAYEFIKFTPQGAEFANTDNAADIEKFNYADVPEGGWHHYAMVKSGTGYAWYVDGVSQGTTNFSYSESFPVPFLMGGDGAGSDEHFQGYIDDVVLYRRALSSGDLDRVRHGMYQPVVTMVVLGSPEELTDGTVWSDGIPAHTSSHYVVPADGNLKSEEGVATFPGTTLTVEAQGKFQFRGQAELGGVTTVNGLIATGGTPEAYVNLAAGTGVSTVNHLAGTLQNDGFTRLSGYGTADGLRNIRISSVISGDGTLFSTGTAAYPHTCTIANAGNTFSGVWESHIGMLVFEDAAAVGSAGINVLDAGRLSIDGDWITGATLTVADHATAEVHLGTNNWNVMKLVFGGVSIDDGVYTAAQLNSFGVHEVFAGDGTLRVGPPPESELLVAWEQWSSDTSAATLENNGITGVASNSAFSLSKWGACTDGTFGSLEEPAASADNSVDTEGLRKVGATDVSIDFVIKNTFGVDIELGAFLFDAMLKRNNGGPQQWSLSVLSGSLTVGEVAGADLFYQTTGSNLADHDVDLTLLEDHTLDAGSSVVFRLNFTGGDGVDSFTDVDNVALLRVINSAAPPLDISFSEGELIFSWTPESAYRLQSRTNLLEGSWIDVPGGDIPPVILVPTNRSDFFRLGK